MTSILTNNGAMVALQTLKGINSNLSQVQEQISTGKKVGNASHNAAAWAIAKTMEADVSSFGKISEGLGVAKSTVATARQASETIVEKLRSIKDLTTQATSETLNDDQRTAIKTDIDSLKEEIATVVNSAQFNGINLINDNTTATEMNVLSSLNRASGGTVTPDYISVTRADLRWNDGAATPGAAGDLDDLFTIAVDTKANAETALGNMDAMIATAVEAAANFGTAQNQIESQMKFVSQLSDNMKAGIGEMVDADMEEASARLQALQVQQQLGVQSLSIANQAPQTVLSLFR